MPSRKVDTKRPTTKPSAPQKTKPERLDSKSGLSVDTEDLARRALEEATEAPAPSRNSAIGLTDPPPTDDALLGPEDDEDRSVWERTVDGHVERED